MLAIAGSVVSEAQAAVAGGQAGDVVAFNSSSTDRSEVVELPDGSLALVSAPACGWSTVLPDRSPAGREQVTIGEGWLDNGFLRVEWDGSGLLTSVWDIVAGRKVLADNERGNLFQLHDDHPRLRRLGRGSRLPRTGHRPGSRGLDRDPGAASASGRGSIRPLLRSLHHHPDDAPGRRDSGGSSSIPT